MISIKYPSSICLTCHGKGRCKLNGSALARRLRQSLHMEANLKLVCDAPKPKASHRVLLQEPLATLRRSCAMLLLNPPCTRCLAQIVDDAVCLNRSCSIVCSLQLSYEGKAACSNRLRIRVLFLRNRGKTLHSAASVAV